MNSSYLPLDFIILLSIFKNQNTGTEGGQVKSSTWNRALPPGQSWTGGTKWDLEVSKLHLGTQLRA